MLPRNQTVCRTNPKSTWNLWLRQKDSDLCSCEVERMAIIRDTAAVGNGLEKRGRWGKSAHRHCPEASLRFAHQ